MRDSRESDPNPPPGVPLSAVSADLRRVLESARERGTYAAAGRGNRKRGYVALLIRAEKPCEEDQVWFWEWEAGGAGRKRLSGEPPETRWRLLETGRPRLPLPMAEVEVVWTDEEPPRPVFRIKF